MRGANESEFPLNRSVSLYACLYQQPHVLSRSIRTSVPLPYARSKIASSSTSGLDKPGRWFTALRSWSLCQLPSREASA